MLQITRAIALYTIVFATGAAGLIYQVTWQKYLSRLLGSDCIATAIILATFLGGLSIGYYVCGRLTLKVHKQFRAYACLEGLIGVWCLFFPALFSAVETITRSWSFLPPGLIIIQGLFCSALLMLVPTVCMGGTIPFLTRGISRNIDEATGVHARVYAINTGGAFAGTLLAGFFLIPAFGLPVTIIGCAFINLFAFVFFFLLPDAINDQSTGKLPKASDAPSAAGTFPVTVLYTIAFLSGFYVMTMENVLIRTTNLSLGSSSYTFSMIVAVFVLSIAIGSYAVGVLKNIPRHLLFLNQALITLFLVFVYATLDSWPYFAHLIRVSIQSNVAGFWLFYAVVFTILTALLILPLGLMGATVPIAFHELKRDLKNVGKHSGFLFSLNTFGNLLGSLVGGIVFYYFMNSSSVYLTAVMLAALSALLAGRFTSVKCLVSGTVLILLCTVLIIFKPGFNMDNFKVGTFRFREPLAYSFNGPGPFFREFNKQAELKFYEDGITATTSVLEYAKTSLLGHSSSSIVINGKVDSSTVGDSSTLKLCAHIPALLSKKRKNILVIGLGTGVTAGELLLYPEVERIDIAEISPSVVKALPFFKDATNGLHSDPRVRIHIGDAFRILKRSSKKWDIIISEPSNPWVSGVDLLFTEEFYRLAKKHLTKDGILVQWVHTYASSLDMVGMICNTLQKEFKKPHVFMTNPVDLQIIAANQEFTNDDLDRAERVFTSHPKVRKSLAGINIKSFDALLLREIWPPAYLDGRFSDFGTQTLDNPRLHYMAGKNFFIGKQIPADHLFTPYSADHVTDFLLVKRYPRWHDFPGDKATFDALLLSTRDRILNVNLPMRDAVKIKAFMSSPDLFPLTAKERKKYRIDLLPFIIGTLTGEKAWADKGLDKLSYRKRAQTLLNHTTVYRNWISWYPVNGLKSLLLEGAQQGKDAYERNWCLLQLVRILIREKRDISEIKPFLAKTEKDKNGDMILQDQDLFLIEDIIDRLKTVN